MFSQQVTNAPNFGRFKNGIHRNNLTNFLLATIILTLCWGGIIGYLTYQFVDAYENDSYLVSASVTKTPSDNGGSDYIVTYTNLAGQTAYGSIINASKTYTVGETVTLRSIIEVKASAAGPEIDKLYENDLTAVLMTSIIPTYLIVLGVQIIGLLASVGFARRAARRQARLDLKR